MTWTPDPDPTADIRLAVDERTLSPPDGARKQFKYYRTTPGDDVQDV